MMLVAVEDANAAANDMNHVLKLINKWAHSWRMSFNPDPQKQAVELIFSRKKNEIDHPVVLFNLNPHGGDVFHPPSRFFLPCV